ncbi:MAG: cbb3-type cytochrome oxidase assembly protein CcoS [Cytophagales bacterium]|jgi:cbb3-type cytochrome oxidase maturation protein|nr:cbb3-type cytochrome oxidase assembly protein CcoS [Cytophagales bacterium]
MSIIYILLTISLIMASIFLGIFIWNLRQGQFDDDYTPSIRMLFEDTPTAPQPPKGEQ